MFRLKIAMVVLGGMLAWFGIKEFRVSNGTTDEPVDVALAEVEAGTVPENNHWRLGEHVALYNACVYEYEEERGGGGDPGPGAKVNYCYYPVLSYDHPVMVQLAKLTQENGDIDNVPDAELPSLEDFAVLVKSKKFKTVGAIPNDWGSVDSLQGLVINTIGSLGSEEAEMFRESFPGLDTDKLVILEEGRTPASGLKSGGMIGGGLLVAIAGGLWMLAGRSTG
ncbi:MAG: hypothetical protein KDA44_01245 [Planctomycetales bacterium]|nr:hypothetical protein [Planctomycetales bacterium]